MHACGCVTSLSRDSLGATQFPTIGLFERNANNFKGTRNTKAQKSWSSRAEPEVRIHLPPAGSLLRTRVFRGVRGARSERAGPVAMPKWVIRGGTPRAASAAFRGLV